MALAFDATTGVNMNVTTSFSHTCAGASRVLYVFVSGWWIDGTTSVSGITYNGVALTAVANSGLSTGNDRVVLYRLVNPASGTNTVTITLSTSGLDLRTQAISYSGASQTVPDGTPQQATGGASTNPSVTQATTSGDVVLDSYACDSGSFANSATMDASTGRTQIYNGLSNSGDDVGTSRHDSPSTPTQVMGWTQNAGQPVWAMVSINVHQDLVAPMAFNQPPRVQSTRPAPFRPGLPR